MRSHKAIKNSIKTTLRINPYLKSLADAMVVRDQSTFQEVVNNALEIYLIDGKNEEKNVNWVDTLPSKKGDLVKNADLSRKNLYKK